MEDILDSIDFANGIHKKIEAAIDKFNDMLQEGKTRGEAYSFLMQQKFKLENEYYQRFHYKWPFDYCFLYPERMFRFEKIAK